MWFLVIVAGIVIVIAAGLLAGPARRAGHPALGGFSESAGLPVLGASIFIALGLAHHDAAGTLAWLVLAYAAGMGIISVAGNLSERARRAGHPALGNFTELASLPVSVASLWVALGLALRQADWTTPAWFLLVYAVCAVWRTLRQRRNNARPPVEPLT
jgi:hypothetical protein